MSSGGGSLSVATPLPRRFFPWGKGPAGGGKVRSSLIRLSGPGFGPSIPPQPTESGPGWWGWWGWGGAPTVGFAGGVLDWGITGLGTDPYQPPSPPPPPPSRAAGAVQRLNSSSISLRGRLVPRSTRAGSQCRLLAKLQKYRVGRLSDPAFPRQRGLIHFLHAAYPAARPSGLLPSGPSDSGGIMLWKGEKPHLRGSRLYGHVK